MKGNRNRRKAIIWAIVTLLAIFATFTHIFGIDDYSGSYPLILLCLLIIDSIGIIVSLHYILQARLLDRILKNDNLLAHWTYSQEEWDQYAETEYRTVNKENRVPYYTLSACALLFGILFFVFNRSSLRWLFAIIFSLIALAAFVWWFYCWYNYRQNRKYLGEAYITPDAVYLNRRLETWRGLGRRLESVFVAEKESQQLLAFTCSDLNRYGRQEYTIRVPVPRGQEKAAEEIAKKLNYAIG
jgi:hypothetical protein